MKQRKVETATATSIGLVRENQEDCAACELLPNNGHFLAVADGIGGHPAGEFASNIAIKKTLWAVEEINELSLEKRLENGLKNANQKIMIEGRKDRAKYGMGTTFVGGVLIQKRFFFANVGDSRAYLLRGNQLYRLTEDQTVSYQEDGIYREYIENWLGRNGARCGAVSLDLFSGDILLLCSDGLHGLLSDTEIANTLQISTHIEDVASELVNQALDNGGYDNVTVVLAKIA